MRVSYIGGFKVGTGVPRCKIVGKITGGSWTEYVLEVTSKSAYGYKKNEWFSTTSLNIFDRHHFTQGPRVVGIGREWENSEIKQVQRFIRWNREINYEDMNGNVLK